VRKVCAAKVQAIRLRGRAALTNLTPAQAGRLMPTRTARTRWAWSVGKVRADEGARRSRAVGGLWISRVVGVRIRSL
jgi:hypothetical protein